MDIQLYQIAVILVAGLMIYDGVSNFVKGKSGQTFFKVFSRIAIWGGMALIALFPKFTIVLARIIGLEGNINAVILTGFILIFLIIFKMLSTIEKLEQQISEIVRKESLKEIISDGRK